MVLQHKDVENFLRCPFLLTKFNSPQKPKSQTKAVIQDCIEQMFMKEMEMNHLPNYKPMITLWGSRLRTIKDMGARGHNNILLSLKELYDVYEGAYYNKGYSTAAVSFMAELQASGNYYFSRIPAILSKGTDILPVFFSDRTELYGRDNEFRFGCAALRHMSQMEINKILVIKVITAPNLSLSINQFNFNKYELQRAEDELRQILKIIHLNYNVPNTLHCPECKFTGVCKL